MPGKRLTRQPSVSPTRRPFRHGAPRQKRVAGEAATADRAEVWWPARRRSRIIGWECRAQHSKSPFPCLSLRGVALWSPAGSSTFHHFDAVGMLAGAESLALPARHPYDDAVGGMPVRALARRVDEVEVATAVRSPIRFGFVSHFGCLVRFVMRNPGNEKARDVVARRASLAGA
jgi:hypothetical protein